MTLSKVPSLAKEVEADPRKNGRAIYRRIYR